MKHLYLDCSSDYMTICVPSRVQDSATPWTVEPIRLLYPWGFSRQEQGSGLNFPDPGIEPGSPALQADSLPAELPGKRVDIAACELHFFFKGKELYF